ncbi:hypothetical protein CVU37_03975 [candidate division BRC1 bacterium HGW-BRC1-1]|jgi:FO synthase|nr:MAG: hypothetical protein CVU37_03975 [candidate division BRC1 bacterium HGW-BRC1-1]
MGVPLAEITFISDYRVYLSRRCAHRCGYCNFQQTPANLPPSRKAVRALLHTAGRIGAHQITLTSGEGIDQWDEISSACRYMGYRGWYDYVHAMARFVLQQRGHHLFFPSLDVGAMPWHELRKMRDAVANVRMMLHSIDNNLQTEIAHRDAPHKCLERRLAALEEMASVGIPMVTGIQVGIGESEETWGQTARIVSDIHRRHGSIQNFVVSPFEPQPYSLMAAYPPVSAEVFLRAVRTVRDNLHSSILLSPEIGRSIELLPDLDQMGISDIGSVTLGNSEHLDLDIRSAIHHIMIDPSGVDLKQRMALCEDFIARRALPEDLTNNIQRFSRFMEQTRGLDHQRPTDSQTGLGGNDARASNHDTVA